MHSIDELAALARNQLNQLNQGFPAGPQPGYPAGSQPGWAAEPQAGPVPGSRPGRRSTDPVGYTADQDLGQAAADVVLGATARFIGRAVSRRVQRTYSERVAPALAARREEMLREQIAIAERHPGLRACLTDQVIFLAGRNRVVPMASVNLGTITLAQADAVVAQLMQP
ncbi:MAG TPA: hypothetical protein VN840_19685 [Streptosporangiaceae bacterium]|nr:hypothetical protein [Streptosporangiaceae bacterium]